MPAGPVTGVNSRSGFAYLNGGATCKTFRRMYPQRVIGRLSESEYMSFVAEHYWPSAVEQNAGIRLPNPVKKFRPAIDFTHFPN
jgi:hypothetical protein